MKPEAFEKLQFQFENSEIVENLLVEGKERIRGYAEIEAQGPGSQKGYFITIGWEAVGKEGAKAEDFSVGYNPDYGDGVVGAYDRDRDADLVIEVPDRTQYLKAFFDNRYNGWKEGVKKLLTYRPRPE